MNIDREASLHGLSTGDFARLIEEVVQCQDIKSAFFFDSPELVGYGMWTIIKKWWTDPRYRPVVYVRLYQLFHYRIYWM